MLWKRCCNAESMTSGESRFESLMTGVRGVLMGAQSDIPGPAGCKHALDVALLADGDGALLPIANDLATEVVLCLAIVSAVEGREEILLEALEVLDGRARTEQVIDVGGHNDVRAVAAARRPSPD
eukprot:2207772-Rhodomonas_salina.1